MIYKLNKQEILEELDQQELMISHMDKNTLQRASTTRSSATDYAKNAGKMGLFGAAGGALIAGPVGAAIAGLSSVAIAAIMQYLAEKKVNANMQRYLNDKSRYG